MRKTYIIVMLLLLAFVPSARAQVNQEKTVTVTNANGKEEQIDLPTSMTEELDSTTQIYKAKNYLTRDPNCNMPDVNRTYSAEVYKQRLSKLPTIIEMPYNDIVQKFIDRYTGELRHSGVEVSSRHRVSPQSSGCLPCRCCGPLAVYDHNG